MRLDLHSTWARLEARGEKPPRTASGAPLVLDAPPRLDAQGLTFFRARKGGDWASLTLPRTFFGRSHVERASFYDSDLTESVLAWSDFVEVTFAACVLVRADLRASVFQECSFKGADLRGADLRYADLASCDFTDARLEGAQVEAGAWWLARLTDAQRAACASAR